MARSAFAVTYPTGPYHMLSSRNPFEPGSLGSSEPQRAISPHVDLLRSSTLAASMGEYVANVVVEWKLRGLRKSSKMTLRIP